MKTPLYWLSILVCGILFGLGLSVSSMIQPEVVLSFLHFEDFGLLLVLASATGLTLVFYQLTPRLINKPFWADKFGVKPMETMKRTLTGAILFGIGWGICGVCPGPAIAGIGAGNWPIFSALIPMFAGAYVQGRWFSDN